MQSFKIPFPPQRLSISEQISHLMEKIPAKIIQREGGSNIKKGAAINGSATATQKRVRLVPIGVCATEMDEEANKHGSIANFFSSLKPSGPAVKEEQTGTDSAKLTQSAKEGTDGQPHFLQQKEPLTGNSTTGRETSNKHMQNQHHSSEPQPCKMARRDHHEETTAATGNNNQPKVLTFVEFYCGVGGWRVALEAAVERIYEAETSPDVLKLQCLAALDHSDLCTKVYQHNHHNHNDDNDKKNNFRPSTTSVEKLTVKKAEQWNASIWAMSPPCQPHARQHDHQNEDLQDPRSKSFLHLCGLIENMAKPPELTLLENVIGFEASGSFRQFRQVLSRQNYWVGNFHLTPTQVGLPNDRPRHFAVAVRMQNSNTNHDNSENDRPGESSHLAECACQERLEKGPQANSNGSMNADSSAKGVRINLPACKTHASLEEL